MKELNRERVRKHRNSKTGNDDVMECNADVTVGNDFVMPSEAEAEAEAEAETEAEVEVGKPPKTKISKIPETQNPDLSKIPVELLPTVEQWMAYKIERREAYKAQGCKAFVSRVLAQVALHGVPAVSEAFLRAMAAGWKGWEIFEGDRAAGGKPATQLKTFAQQRVENTRNAFREVFGEH